MEGEKKELLFEDQLMMLLMYYRLYISQEFLGIIFNLHNCNVSRQINYLHPLLAKIFKIPARKITLNTAELTEEEIIEFFIDAERPKKRQKQYYSGKRHDKKLYDETRTIIPQTTDIIGDLGYLDASRIKLPNKKPKGKYLSKEEKQHNTRLSQRRITVEHSFGKMKIYQILSQRFRNPLAKHSLIFKNITDLHNLMFA